MRDSEKYDRLADAARREAEAASLPHVRERAQKSEASFRAIADRNRLLEASRKA